MQKFTVTDSTGNIVDSFTLKDGYEFEIKQKPKMKYLSEIISEEEILSNSNTLVVAPCGSGKSYFCFNVLAKNKSKNILYLCDTTNLKNYMLKEDAATTKDIRHYAFTCKNVEIMTYKKFGKNLKFNNINEYLKGYDLIIADEVHNLIDYESFNADGDLREAMIILFHKQQIPIVMFAGTNYYITEKQEQYKSFLKDVTIIDLYNNTEIKRYTDTRVAYISHISQIQYELHCYNQFFKFRNGKVLIFCRQIENMKT